MGKLGYRGVACGYALLGCFALLSSCGDSTSGNQATGGIGAGAEAGSGDDTSGSGGSNQRAGSSGGGTKAQGGSGNQAGTQTSGGSAPLAGDGGNAQGGQNPDDAGAGPGEAGMASSEGGAGGEASTPPSCTDLDGDGYGDGLGCTAADCDDHNPLVNPGMLELADDALDNDCTGGDLKAKDGPGYYVNASDANCSDAQNATGTKAAPYCSIELAVIKAAQGTDASDKVGRSIFVAQGTYPNTLGTPRSLRLYGGYDATDWSYDSAAHVTTIGGADVIQDLDGFAGSEMWVNVNGKANAVIQGFHILGGKRNGAPIKAIEINSSGRVELYDDVIVAGQGFQTLGMSIVGETKTDPHTSDVWLIKNRISAGVPTDSSNYGLNNLGTAVLWGNVIDMGQGKSGSFGAAVQNYGLMTLVNNVLNGGDYGGSVDDSCGFINGKADGLTTAGTAVAYHNVIFGGRGSKSSVGVSNGASLLLASNVIGDRTPGPLTFAERPTLLALPLATGFAASTTVENNDLVQLIYSDEASPPNAGANRHLFQYSDNTTHPVDDVATLNGCLWTGCIVSTANLAVAPGFAAAGDFHLAADSVLIGKARNLSASSASGLTTLDIDGQPRAESGRDIGIDER